jgi:TolB protein
MNPDGSEQTNLTNVPADDQLPTWSPDKHWIAFQSDRGGNSEIFIIRPDGSQATNLTNHPANDGFPAWSPDGQWIAFQSDRDGHFEIYVIRSDGSQQNRLTSHTSGNLTPAWSPDGTRIAFASFRDDNPEIYTLNFADAMHAPESVSPLRLTNNPAHDLKPAWSPDGKQIAFQSDRSGSFQIYVVNPDGSGPLIRLTNSSENQYPAWQP